MDQRRFDVFTKAMANGASRRQLLGRFAGGAGGGLLGALGLGAAGAQESERERDEREEREREARATREPRERRQPLATQTPAAQPAQPTAAADPAQTTGAVCRQDGETCGGDQLCCEGLLCVPSGKDQATRCVSSEPVEACAETCEAEEVPVAKLRPYTVEADCQYDEDEDRTTCECAGRSGDPAAAPVRRVTLPQADVCAEVVGGEFEVLQADRPARAERRQTATGGNASAGNGGEANADASGGQVVVGDVEGNNQVAIDASGGRASADASGGNNNVAIAGGGRAVRYASPGGLDRLRLSFAGRVAAAGTATYWCETENGLVPAVGPALVRDEQEDPNTGTIVVRTVACGVEQAPEGFDWYGQCRRPARSRLRLRALSGGRTTERGSGATDDAGRRSFRGLAPGTYRVAPEGGDWCHAECDSADDNGDVLLAAGQRATVWLFACSRGR